MKSGNQTTFWIGAALIGALSLGALSLPIPVEASGVFIPPRPAKPKPKPSPDKCEDGKDCKDQADND